MKRGCQGSEPKRVMKGARREGKGGQGKIEWGREGRVEGGRKGKNG